MQPDGSQGTKRDCHRKKVRPGILGHLHSGEHPFNQLKDKHETE